MNIYTALKTPNIIYSVDSEYNGHIEVLEVGHTRKLKVEGIDQSVNWDSPSCAQLVWGKLVSLLHREEPELKNVLVLGTGGGTVPHLISKYLPNTDIVSVEIDPAMIEVARKYFELDSIPNHKVIINDALRVVSSPEEFGLSKMSFQALVVDIYIGEKYPELGRSGNFIDCVRDMVVPGGLIVFNRIYTEHHHEDVDSFIEQLEGFLVDVKTEVIAGHTNSDNILIYGRIFEHEI
jgi:spermidine synthase